MSTNIRNNKIWEYTTSINYLDFGAEWSHGHHLLLQYSTNPVNPPRDLKADSLGAEREKQTWELTLARSPAATKKPSQVITHPPLAGPVGDKG